MPVKMDACRSLICTIWYRLRRYLWEPRKRLLWFCINSVSQAVFLATCHYSPATAPSHGRRSQERGCMIHCARNWIVYACIVLFWYPSGAAPWNQFQRSPCYVGIYAAFREVREIRAFHVLSTGCLTSQTELRSPSRGFPIIFWRGLIQRCIQMRLVRSNHK